nr:MAG TPA: hypothetical protein [Caudoviricetes sp.]
MKINKEQKYIVRSIEAGVFYGYITEKDGCEVTMKNARCLWYWKGAASLNQLAEEGVRYPEDCKFTMPVEEIVITNVCEILACSEQAAKCIDGVKVWKI